MSVQRQSLGLMDFVVQWYGAEKPQDAMHRAREEFQTLAVQLIEQAAMFGHHDVVAARKRADRAGIAHHSRMAIDNQPHIPDQRDQFLPQAWIGLSGADFGVDRGQAYGRADDLLMDMGLRGARLTPLVFANHHRLHGGVIERSGYDFRACPQQAAEMCLA